MGMSFLKFAFASLATTTIAFQSLPMSGAQNGQLRVYHWEDKTEAGCLTAKGRWTMDEGQCGTFTAQDDGQIYVDRQYEKVILTTNEGLCWLIENIGFDCGDYTESLWIHWPDIDNNLLIYSRSLDGFNVADGDNIPSGTEAKNFFSTRSQSWDSHGDYQVY